MSFRKKFYNSLKLKSGREKSPTSLIVDNHNGLDSNDMNSSVVANGDISPTPEKKDLNHTSNEELEANKAGDTETIDETNNNTHTENENKQ